MARAAAAAAVLFFFLTAAFANSSDIPPVDQDGSGSGDDDDSFSGSGLGPLLEEEFAHGDNADKPTDASLTTALPSVPTENQHPVVEEPESPEEKETVSTTRAVETESISSPSPPEQEDNVHAEETVTDKGSAVVLVPTTTVQLDTVKMDVAHDIFPEVHNIPQDATTEGARHATDATVAPSNQDATSPTEAIEPHKHHHPHHHHHHHHHTTAESVTEAVDTDLHHVPHQETSAPNVTQGLDPHLPPVIKEDTSLTSTVDPHMHHQDADHITGSNVDAHTSTPGAKLLEEDSVGNSLTTASYEESKTNIPVMVLEPESEPDRTDAPEFDGSGGSLDTNDFVFEPSIPRGQAPENKNVLEDNGISDSSKGIMEQKGVLAAVIAGGVAGLVFAVGLVGFMLYRMKKKDEGSYCLEETKQTNGGYEKPIKQEEFYA